MRRIKAIYLIPVFLVLLIGAAVASYYFLFKPQLEKVDAARKGWQTERDACVKEEQGYAVALQEKVQFAQIFFNDYYQFRAIQQQMPRVLNMKELYAGKEDQGLRVWYGIMGRGELIQELDRWVRSFHLPNPPTFTYTGTMGYEESLPDRKMVNVDFGAKTFNVSGLRNLLNALCRVVGHDYYPMIISLPSDTASINIALSRDDPRHNPQKPRLSMPYSATAYFLTRGWDPAGATAATDMNSARTIVLNKVNELKAVPHRTDWFKMPGDITPGEAAPCPPVLFFIQQQGLQP